MKYQNHIDFKTIFNTYYKPLVLYANRFITSINESEDIVQNVFVKFWKQKRDFENEKRLRSFLYVAVKNACFNHLKHQKVKNTYAEKLLSEHSNSQNDLEESSLRIALLHKAINLLPARRKEVLTYTLKGFRNQEIAEHMDIQLQTVKTLKSQAYQQLRLALTNKIFN